MKSTIIRDTTIMKAARRGDVSVEELSQYLIRTYPVPTICAALAEYIIEEDVIEPIAISQEEFYQHFRILGTKRVEGELVKENRGRKVGTKIVDGKVVTPKQ